MSTTDTEAFAHLTAIFAERPDITAAYLRNILSAHNNDVAAACDYILRHTDESSVRDSPPLYSSARRSSSQSRSRRFIDELQPTRVDLSDPASLQPLLNNIKEIVVPALKHQLTGLRFPDIRGEEERISYSLTGLQLTSISLDSSNISLAVHDTQMIDVVARSVSLAMNIAQWSYRMRMPPIRDTGRAAAAFSGVKVSMIFRIGADGVLSLGDCACRIEGDVSFRANDAKMSWLYNTLARVLKTAFRPQLESTLSQAVKHGVQSQLEDWTNWTTHG